MELRSGTVLQPPVPAEQDAFFRDGVRLVMLRWTALQLAVEHMAGGVHSAAKARQIENDVVNFCYRGKGTVYADEIEEVIGNSVISLLSLQVEDGSLEEVSDHIADLFEACKVGDYGPIRELQALEREAVNGGVVRSVRDPTDLEDEEDDEEEEEEQEVGRGGNEMGAGGAGEAGMEVSDSMEVEESGVQNPPQNILSSAEVADGWEVAASKGKKGNKKKDEGE